MASLLFETSPLDPVTYLAVSIGLVVAAALASYAPAARATAVNPVESLGRSSNRIRPRVVKAGSAG